MTDDRKIIDIKTRASLSVEQAVKSASYSRGHEAFCQGVDFWANPHERHLEPDEFREWARGFRQAQWERDE